MRSLNATIPSPTVSVIHLGPLPVHIYALCIVTGIITALVVTDRRWRARGGLPQQVGDVAGWAVVFGIIGGRLYHVITDPELYFKPGKHPIDALKIWDGGLGIWGAIALGALGVYIGCRRHKMNFVAFADAAAPGIVLAQALGRWGNYFNNELYGRATSLPWKLQIHQLDVVTGHAATDAAGHAIVLGYYQPTFLYEMLWDLLVAGALIWADRRYRLARGQVFLLYVMGYTVGRFVVENLRSDTANHVLGMRVNSWVSILVFLTAFGFFLRQRGKPRSSALADNGVAGADGSAAAASASPGAGADEPTSAASGSASAGEPADESPVKSRHDEPDRSDQPYDVREPDGAAAPDR